ncbi:Hypothetical predicted protein, partial [Paramuricea clavata]
DNPSRLESSGKKPKVPDKPHGDISHDKNQAGSDHNRAEQTKFTTIPSGNFDKINPEYIFVKSNDSGGGDNALAAFTTDMQHSTHDIHSDTYAQVDNSSHQTRKKPPPIAPKPYPKSKDNVDAPHGGKTDMQHSTHDIHSDTYAQVDNSSHQTRKKPPPIAPKPYPKSKDNVDAPHGGKTDMQHSTHDIHSDTYAQVDNSSHQTRKKPPPIAPKPYPKSKDNVDAPHGGKTDMQHSTHDIHSDTYAQVDNSSHQTRKKPPPIAPKPYPKSKDNVDAPHGGKTDMQHSTHDIHSDTYAQVDNSSHQTRKKPPPIAPKPYPKSKDNVDAPHGGKTDMQHSTHDIHSDTYAQVDNSSHQTRKKPPPIAPKPYSKSKDNVDAPHGGKKKLPPIPKPYGAHKDDEPSQPP